MGYIENCKITSDFLVTQGLEKPNFNTSGYVMVPVKNMKVFFYSSIEGLRITVIPTNRKYNITEQLTVQVDGFGDFLLVPQPHKTNAELMKCIWEKDLSIETIDKYVKFLVNVGLDIFEKYDVKPKKKWMFFK